MKKLLAEFKAFALKGNVMDMAVGVVVGSAFTAIVSSLVGDIFTPLIAALIGNFDFSSFAPALNGSPIAGGNFINAVISFVIVAICMFIVIKAMNTLLHKKAAEEAPAPAPVPEASAEELLLVEIRDLLKKQAESGK